MEWVSFCFSFTGLQYQLDTHPLTGRFLYVSVIATVYCRDVELHQKAASPHAQDLPTLLLYIHLFKRDRNPRAVAVTARRASCCSPSVPANKLEPPPQRMYPVQVASHAPPSGRDGYGVHRFIVPCVEIGRAGRGPGGVAPAAAPILFPCLAWCTRAAVRGVLCMPSQNIIPSLPPYIQRLISRHATTVVPASSCARTPLPPVDQGRASCRPRRLRTSCALISRLRESSRVATTPVPQPN